MANSHVLLGINPKLNIANYLDGSALVSDLIIEAHTISSLLQVAQR